MESSKTQRCILCDKQATKWCPECANFLCKNYSRHHSYSSSTMRHELVNIENYLELPKSVLSMKDVCIQHNNTYELYCKIHQDLCCASCVSDTHKKCLDFLPINEVIQNAKISVIFDKLEQNLSDTRKEIRLLRKKIYMNTIQIRNQKKQYLSKILNIRKIINEHLDRLQEDLQEILYGIETEVQTKLNKMLGEMTAKLELFDQMRLDITNIKLYASDLQTFLGVKEMTEKADQENSTIEAMNNYEVVKLDITISDDLSSLVHSISSFGEIFTHTEQSTETLSLRSIDFQAPIEVPTTLTKKSTIHLPHGKHDVCVHGCEILEDGLILFADFENKRLITYSEDDADYFEFMNLPGKPFDLVHTKNDNICVTLSDKKGMLFINISTKLILNSVEVGHRCFGNAADLQHLAIRAIHSITSDHEIIFYNFDGKLIHRVKVPGHSVRQICYSGNEVKCTESEKNLVSCYPKDGNLSWAFNDEDIIRYPAGVAEDRNRFIYLVRQETNNVIVISPDGQYCKQILSLKDGLDKPFAVCINVSRNELLVCNFSGKAILFALR
ncbi:unnamed protein product [Mytilus coruscus]|uniref:B box-type domain-containing protein n=1 Tax=Mytilus coruscus TaxID=42192 RepID=A0A6J8CAQ9_MYTCO|nr:unnamed protein product [Mytilus coruscus]